MNEAFCTCQVHRADAVSRRRFPRILNGWGKSARRVLSVLVAAGAGWVATVVPANAAETPAPSLEIRALPDGTRKLDLYGTTGSRFELQVSTNLTVWDRWADITFSEPERSVIDSGPNLPPWRFYRLREAAVVAPSEYLLGLGGAGPLASGLSLANQPLVDGSQNLLAVRRTSPGDAAVVEAAGRWGGDTVNFIQQSSVLESRMDSSSGMRQGTRVRYSVYARENRLWKFDHRGNRRRRSGRRCRRPTSVRRAMPLAGWFPTLRMPVGRGCFSARRVRAVPASAFRMTPGCWACGFP
jgi:hypothetical protein